MGLDLQPGDWIQLAFIIIGVVGAIVRIESSRINLTGRVNRIDGEIKAIEQEARSAAGMASNQAVMLDAISQRQDRDYRQIIERLHELLAELSKISDRVK